MTKAAELRELGSDELFTRLGEARQEAFNLRFQNVTGQLDNHSRLKVIRREIARISTILRETEIAEAEADAARDEAAVKERITARRARVAASQRGVVAGVGREASLAQSRRSESPKPEEGTDDE